MIQGLGDSFRDRPEDQSRGCQLPQKDHGLQIARRPSYLDPPYLAREFCVVDSIELTTSFVTIVRVQVPDRNKGVLKVFGQEVQTETDANFDNTLWRFLLNSRPVEVVQDPTAIVTYGAGVFRFQVGDFINKHRCLFKLPPKSTLEFQARALVGTNTAKGLIQGYYYPTKCAAENFESELDA